MNEPKGFSEHKLMLCLNRKLYLKFIKMQADKNLGRSYAGLQAFIEGLYQLGYLSEKEYQENLELYSETLDAKELKEQARKELMEQERLKVEKELLESKDYTFKGMIEEFSFHSDKPGWCKKATEQAEEFKDRLESARNLLNLLYSRKEGR
jgi:hypothetical protein